VNAAATSVFAGFEDTTPEEFRRVMEVNYLGQVHGALAALPALRKAGGGALIAVSSVEALVSLPMHAAYSDSKHAVDGAMDALRRELGSEDAPISVTSIKPGTINTPFFSNARNKMDVAPKGPPPWYQPKVVADCILYAAEHPVRDLYAGGGGRQMALSQMLMPRQVDAVLRRVGIPATRTRRPQPEGSPGNLYASRDDDRVQGDFSGRARGFSLYTWARLHRPTTAGLAVAVAASTALGRLARRTR
jgi:NAD(P)-dependent dehydrogenase (short-subunit alcohol dehydrogenase family)